MLRLMLCLFIVTCNTPFLYADDPVQPPERIPAPQLVQPTPVIVESYTPRTGTIEVWQHYGVNRLGRFVPRVIVLPEAGAVYSRDLQPFPWAAHRSTAVMPYAVD